MNRQIKSVIQLPVSYSVFDLSNEYEPAKINEFINQGGYAVGGYNEKRKKMYTAPQYANNRNIHMGIDFWAPAGETVFAALDGMVAYTANHAEDGNYGATVVLKHAFQGRTLFALYGHLSRQSLAHVRDIETIQAGATVGWLGDQSENGNWPPHLHYQLSWKDPNEADMQGVVSETERELALKTYPDPRIVLGSIY